MFRCTFPWSQEIELCKNGGQACLDVQCLSATLRPFAKNPKGTWTYLDPLLLVASLLLVVRPMNHLRSIRQKSMMINDSILSNFQVRSLTAPRGVFAHHHCACYLSALGTITLFSCCCRRFVKWRTWIWGGIWDIFCLTCWQAQKSIHESCSINSYKRA